jgi:hypothetical protein
MANWVDPISQGVLQATPTTAETTYVLNGRALRWRIYDVEGHSGHNPFNHEFKTILS